MHSAQWPSVLNGNSRWSMDCADAIEWLRSLPDNSIDLVIGSPPYCLKGERYIEQEKKKKFSLEEWVSFMLAVTTEAVRVARGDVIWVVNNPVKDGCYIPAVEGLVWSWYQSGGKLERPCIWHKNAPPNRKDWFGNEWEFIVCFPAEGKRKVFNWESIGKPPKYTSGGRFRQRGANGERRLGGAYPKNAITRPRDVLRVPVGGGLMGHKLAHENEAPYPVKLVEPFILALTHPDAIVADPFAGSGSTAQTALVHRRRFVGCEIRQSQVDLTNRRLALILQQTGCHEPASA